MPPVGLHLLLLRKQGMTQAAAALTGIAVEQGLDVAVRATRGDARPEDSVEEYEALFAQGVINAPMVHAYSLALAKLGRDAAIAAILDPDVLLWRVRLDLPAPDGRPDGLADRIQQVLLEEEAQAPFQEAEQSVRRMRFIKRFQDHPDPAAIALMAAVREQARSYLARWSASDHVFARHVPRQFRMSSWGLISRGEGYNTPHIHLKGWATGVYYPAEPDTPEGGELRIGPPPGLQAAGWPDLTIRPEPGLLVLTPSFYTHWTVPLDRPGLRTSVVFDVKRELGAKAEPAG
jgi:hypothetical protein